MEFEHHPVTLNKSTLIKIIIGMMGHHLISLCLSLMAKVCLRLRRRIEFSSWDSCASSSTTNFKCCSLKSAGRSFKTHSWRISSSAYTLRSGFLNILRYTIIGRCVWSGRRIHLRFRVRGWGFWMREGLVFHGVWGGCYCRKIHAISYLHASKLWSNKTHL